MSRAVREVHMIKYGAPSLSPNRRASSSGGAHSPPDRPGTSSDQTTGTKRQTLDTRTHTVRHLNTLFPSYIDDSPSSNYLAEAVPGQDSSASKGGLGASGYGTKAGKQAEGTTPNGTDGERGGQQLTAAMEYRMLQAKKQQEIALAEHQYPVDWRRTPTTQYDSLKASIAAGSPIGRPYTPEPGGGSTPAIRSTTSQPRKPGIDVSMETKMSGITWVYAAINLSILPDLEMAVHEATRLVDRLLHSPSSEFQLPQVLSGVTRRSDVRDMLRDPRRFGVLVDIVATRRTIMTGVPHNVATAIYHHCDERYPIYVKFVFVGVTDNGTKRVARDVFAGGNVPKNNTGVWASAEGGVPHPIPFESVDNQHQFIVHPNGEEAERLREKGREERLRAERESAARKCTAKYVPPPPPEWLVKLQAREERLKLQSAGSRASMGPHVKKSPNSHREYAHLQVSNATLLYGPNGESSPLPQSGGFEQLYGRSSQSLVNEDISSPVNSASPMARPTSSLLQKSTTMITTTPMPGKSEGRPTTRLSSTSTKPASQTLIEAVESRRGNNADVAKYFISSQPVSRPVTSNMPSPSQRPGGQLGRALSESGSRPPSSHPDQGKKGLPAFKALPSTTNIVPQSHCSNSRSHLIQHGASMLLSASANNATIRNQSVGKTVSTSGGSPLAKQRRRRRRQLLDMSARPTDLHSVSGNGANSSILREDDGAASCSMFLRSQGDGDIVETDPHRQLNLDDVSSRLSYVGDSSARQLESVEWARIGKQIGALERRRHAPKA